LAAVLLGVIACVAATILQLIAHPEYVPVLDKSRPPGVLAHLGDAGQFEPSIEMDMALGPGKLEWSKGRPDAAMREWTKVAARYGRSEWAFPALDNIGRLASSLGDRKRAIDAFTKLVDIPTSKPKRVLHTLEYRDNYKHHACVALSDLYLEQRDPTLALKYAEMARDDYPIWSPCGTFNFTVRCELDDRIGAIKSALAGGTQVVIEPRSTALASHYSERRGPAPPNPRGLVR
jgi:hypothetical protein